MKNSLKVSAIILIALSATMTSCSVVGGIFKAGMGFGIFIVVAIIAVIVFVISRAGKS